MTNTTTTTTTTTITTSPAPSPFGSGADRRSLSNPVVNSGITDFRIFNPFRTTSSNGQSISINTSDLLIQAAARYEKYAANMRNGPITVNTTTTQLPTLTVPSPQVTLTTTTLAPYTNS